MTAASLPSPTPDVNPETRAFWESAANGVLLLKRCPDCGAVVWYPRELCPECGRMNTEWFAASGRGVIYSYTVNHRGEGAYKDASPFVVAYVELEEGPRVLTNIVGADPDALAIGDAVEVVFTDAGEGAALFRFRPVAAI